MVIFIWNHSQQIMLTSSFPVICNFRLRSRQLFRSYSNSNSAFRLLIEVACVLRMLNWTAKCRHDLPASASFIKATLCRSVSAFLFFDMITLEWRNWYWITIITGVYTQTVTSANGRLRNQWRSASRRQRKQLWCPKQVTNVRMYSRQSLRIICSALMSEMRSW